MGVSLWVFWPIVIFTFIFAFAFGRAHGRLQMWNELSALATAEDEDEDPGCPACGWYGGEHTHECPLSQTT